MKLKFNKIPIVTRSKASLRHTLGLVGFPRDCEGNHPWRAVESWQGNVVAVGHEEVARSYPTCSTANRSQSYLPTVYLPALSISLNINLSST